MQTPEPPQPTLSDPQTAETLLAGVHGPEAPRWALYARSAAARSRPDLPGEKRPQTSDVVELQLDVLRELVAGRGTIVGEYTDVGPSRAGRAAMLAAAADGKVTRVAVTALDRLGRQDLAEVTRSLREHGVRVTTVEGDTADFARDLMLAVSQYEHEHRKAMRRKRGEH